MSICLPLQPNMRLLDAWSGFTVVKARCHAVQAQVWVHDELWFRPFSCFNTIMGLDMTIDCSGAVRICWDVALVFFN